VNPERDRCNLPGFVSNQRANVYSSSKKFPNVHFSTI